MDFLHRILPAISLLLILSLPCESTMAQWRDHTPPVNAHPLMLGQDQQDLTSVLVCADGAAVERPEQWWAARRPELHDQWTEILGKLGPSSADRQWFGDITQATEIRREQKDGYTRIELLLPMEKDFQQPHLLLIPDEVSQPCPAVIAWTSTSPDYMQPEEWWGAWLARRGCVVLTGWAFIRNYRDGTSYRNNVQQMVYDRFGRWLPMGKMVHDVQREVEFLTKLSTVQVDPERIGFIGFSLSAKTALYVAAFAPEIRATVSIDPHLAIYGSSNYPDPWYLDARQPFPDIRDVEYPDPALRKTVWSLLDTEPARPGFEHNHHELLALAAPRHLMIIG
ncbi:MAG: dienelactone hydrolase family protein, partial [Planctomycetaceae bacterium]|nr:dienelactone hydrolase family protein [Planctomycetaceae bacterium]